MAAFEADVNDYSFRRGGRLVDEVCGHEEFPRRMDSIDDHQVPTLISEGVHNVLIGLHNSPDINSHSQE
jgi:hypothetical protein